MINIIKKIKDTAFFQGYFLFSPYVFKRYYWHKYLIAILIIGIDLGVATQLPLFTKNVIDSLQFSLSEGLISCILMVAFLWIIDKTAHYVQDLVFFPIINQTVKDLTAKTVKKMHRISFEEFQKFSIPQVSSALKRVSQSARNFIKITFLHLIPVMGKIAIAVILLLQLRFFNSFFYLIIFLWCLTYVYGTHWYLLQRKKAWEYTDKVTQEIVDTLRSSLLIRFSNDSPSFQTTLEKEAYAWLKTNQKQQWVSIILGILMGIAYGIGLYLGAEMVIAKEITLGEFVMAKGILLNVFIPLKSLSLEIRQINESLTDIKSVQDILKFPLQIEQLHIVTNIPPSENDLTVENVTYGYPLGGPLLKNINLEVKKGQKILLQGPNGSGKSTLCHLMAGLYIPKEGNVWIRDIPTVNFFLADRDLSDLPLKNLSLHFIPQKVEIFDQSVLYNLTYGCSSFSVEEQQEVLSLLQLESFLDPSFKQTALHLSEGEKQRLALARALLSKPEILILDESTAFLDPAIEKSVLSYIFKRIPTIIIVAHGFPYLEKIDKIYTIKQVCH